MVVTLHSIQSTMVTTALEMESQPMKAGIPQCPLSKNPTRQHCKNQQWGCNFSRKLHFKIFLQLSRKFSNYPNSKAI